MENSLPPVINSIIIGHIEGIALDTADHKPDKWIDYFDNNFVVWPHGPPRFHYHNSIRPNIKLNGSGSY
jgi:hypothetical protein